MTLIGTWTSKREPQQPKTIRVQIKTELSVRQSQQLPQNFKSPYSSCVSWFLILIKYKSHLEFVPINQNIKFYDKNHQCCGSTCIHMSIIHKRRVICSPSRLISPVFVHTFKTTGVHNMKNERVEPLPADPRSALRLSPSAGAQRPGLWTRTQVRLPAAAWPAAAKHKPHYANRSSAPLVLFWAALWNLKKACHEISR